MKYMLGLLVLLTVSAWTKAGARTTAGALSQVVKKADAGNNNEDEGKLTVAEQLEKANNNLNRYHDGIRIRDDIIVARHRTKRSTKPSTLHDRLWPKSSDGKVYIPYIIANHYPSEELDIIKKGIDSFSSSTCIRFLPRTTEKDFLYIQSLNGCYSYLGRQGYGQIVSLSLQGCIYLGTVQHELLHALGFNHEHCRSDRDQHVQVLLQNVMKGQDFNFKKVNTLNQETPYDYSSVMHYGRLAFSKDDHNPTMVAVPKSNSEFGTATEMNQNDINRINLLYCSD
ncbi:low choriolytic enzyme-like isoform X2 [Acanthopagrus latus]|uniref:low choriolytic enzyme-like isoform X2 n=1 Tax=Acanthopagrus latus TaxID=8177 RepID=UPI00187C6235|nr:low choriolytic enzyme-like isoform X2 [Acanthopagrus latus]XP_036964092.1 low choriolytic enzyme-like isoform X2 [Acanthopagrus latus]XP_036964093.1 low choriolytic enzyme-like isoform X2 [Acanthopagrus latus]